jgi:hypothetical protein
MLNINFTAAVSEGGADRPKVSAIEVLPQASGAALTALLDSLNRALLLAGADTAKVFPNPSRDGRFKVVTAVQFAPDAGFVLLSPSGSVLRRGALPPYIPGSAMSFDLSMEMRASGVYYLQLTDRNKVLRFKLIRGQ